MARDPPSLLASSELRDLPLEPSSILDARITIIHPQLRDLILPLERRKVLYPRGSTIEELRWSERDEDGDDCEDSGKSGKVTASLNPFIKLNFTPNCLTGSRGMLAAGGQHGELHISHIPRSTHTRPPLRGHPSHGSYADDGQLFRLDVKLGTSAINNAIVLLPEWPLGWAELSDKRRIGYVGRRGSSEYDDVDDNMEGTEEGGQEDELDIEDDDRGIEEDEDEAMDLDEDGEGGGDEGYPQPLSPATYPNTVAPRHAPRIRTSSTSSTIMPSRRAASFSYTRTGPSQAELSRLARQSFSLADHPQRIRIVSSNASQHHLHPAASPPLSPSGPSHADRARADPRARHGPQPRLLVSSNDQSIRMLVLRQLDPTPHPDAVTVPRPRTNSSYERESEAARLGRFEPTIRTHYRPSTSTSSALMSTDWRGLHPVLPPPPPMMGSRFGWDSVGINQGLLEAHRAEQMAAQREMRTRQIGNFEAAVGMAVAPGTQRTPSIRAASAAAPLPALRMGAQAPWSQVRATASDGRQGKRVVNTIGGKTLSFPVNHSSFSPDLKTMVSVGDSTDVQVFEVVDGGREFRQIATYTAATDSAFSSAWSKDGRKFAVASQDGQVTVWDHRSSRPLATLFTSISASSQSLTRDQAFTEDGSASGRSPSPTDGWSRDRVMMMFNPLTGEPSSGASTSGREAARVIKFSPEGSSRDLMVFSEENTNIHIIDAKTFNTHVILPVPTQLRGDTSPLPARVGVEGGECGIAGIAFDQTGEWLYSGTERTVVEWDMRRMGGGEGGEWSMA